METLRVRLLLGLVALALTLAVAACGGSASNTTTNNTANNMNGVFADAPVVGLSYSCAGITGVTQAGGTFTCASGSTVKFTVGGVTICNAPAHAIMTPVSCAQASGNPSANASTASVVAIAQFLISIGTPPGTTPGSLSTLTITSAEIQAASALTLDFSTATQGQLQTAVSTVNPGQTLVSVTTAQNELTGTINTATTGSYSGNYSGGANGTWALTIDSSGSVSGTYTDTKSGTGPISGALVFGTTFSGSAGSASWTGTVDTSKAPAVGKGPYLFSGTWSNTGAGANGTFTN